MYISKIPGTLFSIPIHDDSKFCRPTYSELAYLFHRESNEDQVIRKNLHIKSDDIDTQKNTLVMCSTRRKSKLVLGVGQ